MEIKRIPIAKIKLAKYNPRKDLKPDDPEYKKLKDIIDEFDLVEPLVWNKRNSVLVGGHQRLKILKARGDKEVEVSVVDLDEHKEMALNVALNNPKAQGEWDYPKLKDVITIIDTGAFNVKITGFDEIDLKEIFDYEGLDLKDNKKANRKTLITCPECGYEFER